MATTTTPQSLQLQKWRRDFVREFVRESGFAPYMGRDPTNIIQVMSDLRTGGRTVTIPLVARLKGSGVAGNQALAGNEEPMDQFNHDLVVEWYRNAILLTKREQHFSAPDQMAVVRPLLREWASEELKYDTIEACHEIDGIAYSQASEAQKDAWLTNNNGRVLFGSQRGNNASNDHSAALGQIDNTNDKLSAAMGILAKRMAKLAKPHITPFRTGTQGREYFVMFTHPRCFRDLKTDATMIQANREARERNVETNPIFQDGDLIYDGVIYREIPEFESSRDDQAVTNPETTLTGVGSGGIDVGANFLCGRQALGLGWAQLPIPTVRRDDDYGFIKGRGIEHAYGIDKLQRQSGSTRIDHGMVTVYAAGVGDA